jgi:hypothetical protein
MVNHYRDYEQPKLKKILSGTFSNDFRALEKIFPMTFGDMEAIYDSVLDGVLDHFSEPTENLGYYTNEKLESLRREQENKLQKIKTASKKGVQARKKAGKATNGQPTVNQTVNHRSTRRSEEPEPEPEPDSISTSTSTSAGACEGFANAPSLDQVKKFAELHGIPSALVEKWHSKSELGQWANLDGGREWGRVLLAYWKAIPPKAQAEWREKPTNGRKIISADKTNRPDKPQIRPENITTL